MEHFEVIIVGGGIVGSAAACALGAAGVRVAVVEAREQQPDAEVRDARMYAITRASERILRALEVWDAIAAHDPCAFTDMEVWDAVGNGALHFDAAELGEPCLGYILEPRSIATALQERLRTQASVSVLCPASCAAVHTATAQAGCRAG